jgi:peptidoglycan hydrolase CwlO-like protein
MKVRVLKGILCVALLCGVLVVKGQTLPAVLDSGTVKQQLEYLEDKTNIYNNYRAVRNDMFLKLKSNVLESESKLESEIQQLTAEINSNTTKIDELQSELTTAKTDLEQAIETKNSFQLLGINIDKVLYNTVLWVVILALAALTAFIFLLYKRSSIVTNNSKKDLDELKEQFETYKKQSRVKQEKLVVNHHQEMMKLKKEYSRV